MPIIPPHVRHRMLEALGGMPDVLCGLLRALGTGSSEWDFRPDPARFTVREVVAHLADWEQIWAQRMAVTRSGGNEPPVLPYWDTDDRAQACGYSTSDPAASLTKLRSARANLMSFLRSLNEAEWELVGIHERHGPMSLEVQAAQVMTHDGYHLVQVAQWLALAAEKAS